MFHALERLTVQQNRLLVARFGDFRVLGDMSWGLLATTVLDVETDEGRVVVKAGGAADRHIAREITAHESWTTPWLREGRAARMLFADRPERIVVTEYLPGHLVQNTAAVVEPATYRQAGALLASFHAQHRVVDTDYERLANARTLGWLASPHRIGPDTTRQLREVIENWPTPPTTLVPTHGDWQSRNWLTEGRNLKAIDFGRTDLRPPAEDFERLTAREFVLVSGAEEAFLDGYGPDPREPDAWFRQRVRTAVSVAVRAFHSGDEEFETVGHRMITEALSGRDRLHQ